MYFIYLSKEKQKLVWNKPIIYNINNVRQKKLPEDIQTKREWNERNMFFMKGNVLKLLLTAFTHIHSSIDSKSIDGTSRIPCILVLLMATS